MQKVCHSPRGGGDKTKNLTECDVGGGGGGAKK